ncbi:MAG: phytoene desaturase [Alphaproteobacteria bacterium]|nr:phytoene desaturase [Alphaproteobacteria bacterium]
MLKSVEDRKPGGDGRPHAVVIGSGFGGLAAAVRLGARGYRVTVLEKLDAPGGRAYVFKDEGYVFDAGPTIITVPFLLEELWELAGRRFEDDIELREMNPFYGIRFDDGDVVHCYRDADVMREEVKRIAPEDADGYERFLKKSQDIFEVGFQQLAHVPFHTLKSMAKVTPDLIRLESYRSVHSLVAQYIKNPKLQVALNFHPLLVGGNPFAASSFYCLISYLEREWGVHFVMGGTGKLVDGLVDLIEGQGGAVICDAEAAQITTKDGRATGVKLADGRHVSADIVISNAEVGHTYKHLLSETKRKRWTDRKVDGARQSMSLFLWYFGTGRTYPEVDHHTIILGPRYRGLLNDIFTKKKLADDFSLYLHRPTATDPSMAPDGCEAFYVLSPVPNLKGDTDWTEMAEPYRQAVEKRLEETVLPGLKNAVTVSRVMTPIDFRDRLNSTHGAAFGLEPILTQSAWFRAHNKSEEVEGLYLVGAGTHPGAGVPGVLSSARVLDAIVPDAAACKVHG